RRAPPGPAVLALVLAAVGTGLFLPIRRAPRAGSAPAEARPNLLLVVWDTTRADHLEPYGYDRGTTPHLARFAAEAVVFESVRSASCFTFSSHLSLLTGVHPSTHGGRLLSMRYDPRRAPAIADTLRRAGWRTGGFVGTDVLAGRTGLRHGFEVWDDRVDPPVCDTRAWKLVHDLQSVLARAIPALRNNGNPHWFQDFQRPASEVFAAARAWIGADDPRPWFCLVNVYDPHWPYVPVGPGRELLVRDYDGPLDGYLFRSDRWREGTAIGAADASHVADLYDAELHDLDLEMDAFLRDLCLEEGRTAVIVTSDHGEAFGEAGRWAHEDILEPQVRVPLLVRPAAPRPAGARVAAPASGVDVAPTLLALAGVPAPAEMEGLDLLAAAPAIDRALLVEDRDRLDATDVRVALYRGPWKLVRAGLPGAATFALYDLAADPLGAEDVSARHPEILATLSAELAARRARADAAEARAPAERGGADDGLRALGYAGR
ncbi:MAG: sulfatase-like hydrolase/transferase, partial [Planctomycetota bacterium]